MLKEEKILSLFEASHFLSLLVKGKSKANSDCMEGVKNVDGGTQPPVTSTQLPATRLDDTYLNQAAGLECQQNQVEVMACMKSNEVSLIGSANVDINRTEMQKLDAAKLSLPVSDSDSCMDDAWIERNSPVVAGASPGANHQAEISSSSGLERSQTMPSGSPETIDGELCSSASLPRSNTDLTKQRRDAENQEACIPGVSKISYRKKKKLLKRIATIQNDGIVHIDVPDSANVESDLYGDHVSEKESRDEVTVEAVEAETILPLQIAMLIVGTRGDVQPFVAIGKCLQEQGHRVRLATHANFKDFVRKSGLEFFPLGGDPKVLAGYMVKNKGFLPSGPIEIRTQRKQMKSIINSMLPACTELDENRVPFTAQAIIANPPAFGQVHVAEYLQIPLHIFFTMPWTPTSEFPHPLSRVSQPAAYKLSYQLVDTLIWLGIRGMINDFRKKKLKIRRITYLSGYQGSISDYPTGYVWSPHLVPKPKDWGHLVDIVGFCFLDLAKDYKPPEDLVSWLQSGTPPIYVGFGSLPVEDPQGMTEIIVNALKMTNQRGIIDKGWGGIGNLQTPPESVYLLENCPHDWLFPQCAAVVHHGGAGTTAAGLKAACPTTIVPFFGDQPFWGERVYKKGIGPAPIPVTEFCLEKLVDAIKFMLKEEVKEKAEELAQAIGKEDGVAEAVKAFHKHLPEGMLKLSPPRTKQNSPPPFRGLNIRDLWKKMCTS